MLVLIGSIHLHSLMHVLRKGKLRGGGDREGPFFQAQGSDRQDHIRCQSRNLEPAAVECLSATFSEEHRVSFSGITDDSNEAFQYHSSADALAKLPNLKSATRQPPATVKGRGVPDRKSAI